MLLVIKRLNVVIKTFFCGERPCWDLPNPQYLYLVFFLLDFVFTALKNRFIKMFQFLEKNDNFYKLEKSFKK